MRTLPVLLAGVLLALAAAATASAKEIAAVEVCGTDGCRDVTAQATGAAVDSGPPAEAPAAAAPFYRVKVTMLGGKERWAWSNLYVPSAGAIRGDDGTWMAAREATVAELDRLVAGSRPFPAEELGLPMPKPAPAPPAAGPPVLVWALVAAALLGLLGAAITVRRRGGAAPAG